MMDLSTLGSMTFPPGLVWLIKQFPAKKTLTIRLFPAEDLR
jgi:hypothetical protein